MTIIICAFCAGMNILVAMNSTNPEVWANWMSAGFCWILFGADDCEYHDEDHEVTEDKG